MNILTDIIQELWYRIIEILLLYVDLSSILCIHADYIHVRIDKCDTLDEYFNRYHSEIVVSYYRNFIIICTLFLRSSFSVQYKVIIKCIL